MQIIVLFLVALGIAFLLYSFVQPVYEKSREEKEVVNSQSTVCSEIDFMFQRNLSGGLIDKNDRRNQVYERMAKLAPEIKRLNQEMANIYDDLYSTWDAESVPKNFKELDYQYGQKLITVPLEDRQRGTPHIPNFERPTFTE
jgi:hypothetical protein